MASHSLVDFVILLTAAVVLVPFSQALKIGTVPGFLIAGFAVGPSGLAVITEVEQVAIFAEIGVVFLLFIIGIEMKPSRIWQMRRLVFGLGAMQLIATGIVIAMAGYFLLDLSLKASLLIGLSLALSSTAFVLQLLTEGKSLTAVYGRTAFAILLLQDLAVVPLLAFVPLLVMPEINIGAEIGVKLAEALMIVFLVIVIGRYLLHPILHRVAQSGSPEIFTISAVLIVLGTAILTEHAGLSMAMGAFLAGLLISDSSYRHQVKAEIQPFRGLMLGMFFMSMGMSFNLSLLIDSPYQMMFLMLGLVLLKFAVLFPIAYFSGLTRNNSLAVSLILAQSGEFALVLFAMAKQTNVLDILLYEQLILIVVLSMLVTPILSTLAQKAIKTQEPDNLNAAEEIEEAPVVIAGYGRVGHRLGEILRLAEIPFVALDSNSELVARERAKGTPIFFGDVRQSNVLNAAGAKNAQVIIVTINYPDEAESVISALRANLPDVEIYSRAHDLENSKKLKKIGANAVVSENLEASIELSSLVLNSVGIDRNRSKNILDDYRISYYNQVNED